MTRQAFTALTAVAAFIAVTGQGQAQTAPLGTISAYRPESLRVYDAAGVREATLRLRSELPPPPATIVAIAGNGQLGIRARGSTIYLRGMDVEFTLTQAGRDATACSPVSAGVRASGVVVAGTRAGGGSSTDCRVTP